LSPTTEPRSISKLPKPTEKEKPPERSIKKREGRDDSNRNGNNRNNDNDPNNNIGEDY
jgi:hypothetical protein